MPQPSTPISNTLPTSFAAAIPVPTTPAPDPTARRIIPTSPDTSSPWPEDSALNGWSARMFLRQLLVTSEPVWSTSDTDALLSGSNPHHLRASFASGIMLSDVILPPGSASGSCFRSARMAQGLIRRALARGLSLRLLLRTERDTIPVIVIFGSRRQDYASWTIRSGKPLPDSLKDGLLGYLRQCAPICTGTLPCQESRGGLGSTWSGSIRQKGQGDLVLL